MSRARIAVAELELAAPLEALALDAPARSALILARLHGRPVGWLHVATDSADRIDGESLREAIVGQLGWTLTPSLITGAVRPQLAVPPDPPPIAVVVCSRDRPDELNGCLTAVRALRYPCFEVVVVDNASRDERTAGVAARHGVRCVREPLPGLDRARNRGIAETTQPVIAFTDDDARPDPLWLAAIAEALREPSVAAVTGLVGPLELETEAQMLFEFGYRGMAKGFAPFHADRRVWPTREVLRIQRVGVGANMAFRRSVFDEVGGFDPALDVGTPSHGGGDLELLHRVVAAGLIVRYEPSALVWHRHRRTLDALERQLRADGRAYSIYLMRTFAAGTVRRSAVLVFAYRDWIRWLVRRTVRAARGREPLPFRLVFAPIRGVLSAPTGALRTSWAARRLDRVRAR